MVLVLKTLVELWRERLAYLDERHAAGGLEPRTLEIERRVLAFFFKRHADADYAEPPRRAEPLDEPSAEDSARLRMSAETLKRLGLDATDSGISMLREIRARRPWVTSQAERRKTPSRAREDLNWPQSYLDSPVFHFRNYPDPHAPEPATEPVEHLDEQPAPVPPRDSIPAEWLPLSWCLVVILAVLLACILLGRL